MAEYAVSMFPVWSSVYVQQIQRSIHRFIIVLYRWYSKVFEKERLAAKTARVYAIRERIGFSPRINDMYPISFRLTAIPLPLFLLRSLFAWNCRFIEHVGYFYLRPLVVQVHHIGDPYNFFIRIIGVDSKSSRMNLECLWFRAGLYGAFIVDSFTERIWTPSIIISGYCCLLMFRRLSVFCPFPC
jgi:hypothetical protein